MIFKNKMAGLLPEHMIESQEKTNALFDCSQSKPSVRYGHKLFRNRGWKQNSRS